MSSLSLWASPRTYGRWSWDLRRAFTDVRFGVDGAQTQSLVHGHGIALCLSQGTRFLEEVLFLRSVIAGGTRGSDVEDDADGRGRGGWGLGVVGEVEEGVDTGTAAKVGGQCPCGSGKKWRKCWRKAEMQREWFRSGGSGKARHRRRGRDKRVHCSSIATTTTTGRGEGY